MLKYLPYLAGVGVALTWGMSFMFTSGALDTMAPFHLLGLRFAAALAAMAFLRGIGVIRIKVNPRDYLSLLPLTFFQPFLYFAAETHGVLLTSASYSGMMIAIIPIVVAILAAFILKEYPSHLQAGFIIASVMGVIFIIYMDSQSIAGVNPLGTIALLGAVIAAASFNIASRKASVNFKPIHITWIMMVVGAIVFNSISIGQHLAAGNLAGYLAPLSYIWPTIFYLGVISSVAAFFMYNFVLSKVTAAQAAVFANMVTVVAIAGGVIFRGDNFFWYQIVGTALILAGVWGTNRFAPAPQEYKEPEDSAVIKQEIADSN